MIIDAISTANVDYNNSAFTGLSTDAQDLIRSMLKRDPDDRITCEEILSHPWFENSKKMLPITYNITKKLLGFKIISNVTRKIMVYIVEELVLVRRDYTILGYFRSLDLNEDGKASKEEILNVFNQVGLNVVQEIDFIMENLDPQGTGKVKYLDLILGLTNWPQEFKKKNLNKYFNAEGGYVVVNWLKDKIGCTEQKDWDEFLAKMSVDEGKIQTAELKKILKMNISNLT
jgi:calcium-dependent protein kinase